MFGLKADRYLCYCQLYMSFPIHLANTLNEVFTPKSLYRFLLCGYRRDSFQQFFLGVLYAYVTLHNQNEIESSTEVLCCNVLEACQLFSG